MTRFGVLHEDGTVTNERDIAQERIGRCPAIILVAEHYPEDDEAPCRCFNPGAFELAAWGYRWSESLGRWA